MFRNLKIEILAIFCLVWFCACASTPITTRITYPIPKEKPIMFNNVWGFGYKIKMYLKHSQLVQGKKVLKDFYVLYIRIANGTDKVIMLPYEIRIRDKEDIPIYLFTPEGLATCLTDYFPGQNTASLYGTMVILAQPQITYAPQINTNVRVNTSSSGYIGHIPDRSSQLGYATGQAMAGVANPLGKMLLLNSIIAEEQEKFKKWLEIKEMVEQNRLHASSPYLAPGEAVAGKIYFRATPDQFPIKIKFKRPDGISFSIENIR